MISHVSYFLLKQWFSAGVHMDLGGPYNTPGSPYNTPGSPYNTPGSPYNTPGSPYNTPGSPQAKLSKLGVYSVVLVVHDALPLQNRFYKISIIQY